VVFPEATGQVQALFNERHRGVLLPLAHQDPSSLMQQLGDQVVVPGGLGDGQRLLTVVLGDRVAARVPAGTPSHAPPNRSNIAADPSMPANKNVRVCVATCPGLLIEIDANNTAQKPSASPTEQRKHHTSAARARPGAATPADHGGRIRGPAARLRDPLRRLIGGEQEGGAVFQAIGARGEPGR